MTFLAELDPERRNALLDSLPPDSQKLVTATAMPWRDEIIADIIYEMRDRRVHERCDRRVIPSEVEGSRDVTFKLPHRDPRLRSG